MHDHLCELDWAWECWCHIRAFWRDLEADDLAAAKGE